MPGIKELLFSWGSGGLLATFMLVSTNIQWILHFVRGILPPEVYAALHRYTSNITYPLHRYISNFLSFMHEHSIIIKQFHNDCHNDCFEAVQHYTNSKSGNSARVQELFRAKNSNSLSYTIRSCESFEEIYDGFKVKWSLPDSETTQKKSAQSVAKGAVYYKVTFMERYKQKVQSSYIPYVIREGDKMKSKNRKRYLYTNRSGGDYMNQMGRNGPWTSVPFSHSSTFDTMALDPSLKEEIKADLLMFINRQEYYERVGKTWKRGYLLYGPPGTGKTSLIAAIANFLEFDIYDLELKEVYSNSQLRKLLISTSSKSVIIVEDIDCSLDLAERKKKTKTFKDDDNDTDDEFENDCVPKRNTDISLSGVLNFADGLWSSCGEERLLIFTTNHIEKLDQALLRPGRMDKHINLSYCEIGAFMILMKNYLGIDQHELVKEVEKVLPLVMMTPADIAEIFMGVDDDADKGMKNVVEAMMKQLKDKGHILANEEEEMGGSVPDAGKGMKNGVKVMENPLQETHNCLGVEEIFMGVEDEANKRMKNVLEAMKKRMNGNISSPVHDARNGVKNVVEVMKTQLQKNELSLAEEEGKPGGQLHESPTTCREEVSAIKQE